MDPIVPIPKLLALRVPAYELPTIPVEGDGLKLLQFGQKLVEVQPFNPAPPDTRTFMCTPHPAELSQIEQYEHRSDQHCQVDLPIDPVIHYLTKETETDRKTAFTFSEVTEIHESDYKGPVSTTQKVSLIAGVLVMPPPTQKFTGTLDVAEAHYSDLPPRPLSKDQIAAREESRKAYEADENRLRLSLSQGRSPPRPSLEVRTRIATDEIAGHMRTISDLQREIEARDKEIEDMQALLDRESRDKAAMTTMAGIKFAEDKIRAMEDEALDDDERTALILARNKELFAEIDLAFAQKQTQSIPTLEEIPTKAPLANTKTTRKSDSLKPNIAKHPPNYRRKSPALTRRISSAFRTAERAIKVAAGTKRLVPAVLTKGKK